jgi:hypothetical protein
MTRLLEILISLAIVAVLFTIIGFILPSSRHLEHSVETNRKMTIVFDTLNSARRFKDWNPAVAGDPGIKIQLSGPETGVGAKVSWDSDQKALGQGQLDHRQERTGQAGRIRDRGHRPRAQQALGVHLHADRQGRPQHPDHPEL